MSSTKPPSHRKGSISPGPRVIPSPPPPWSAGPPQRSAAIRANALLRESESPQIIPSSVGPKATRRAKRPADSSLSSDEEKSLDDSESDQIHPSPTPDAPTLSPELLAGLGEFLEHHRRSVMPPNRKRSKRDAPASSSPPLPPGDPLPPASRSNSVGNVHGGRLTHTSPVNVSINLSPPHSPSTGPSAHSASTTTLSSSPIAPVASAVMRPFWNDISDSPALQHIIPYPAISFSQRKDLRNYEFVGLCYFLPLPNSTGIAPPSFGSPESTKESTLSAMFDEYSQSDPTHTLNRRRSELKNMPLFHRWDQVVTAFAAGLIPAMCQGRPDRLADYSAFLTVVIAEYTRGGEEEWPVYLKYIEDTRRRALVEGESHSLTKWSVPSAECLLDSHRMATCRLAWATPSRASFAAHGVSPTTLHPSYSRRILDSASPTPPPSLPMPPTQSVKREQRPAPLGLSAAQWDKAIRINSMAFCRNHLRGSCSNPCPRNLPHLSATEVSKLPL